MDNRNSEDRFLSISEHKKKTRLIVYVILCIILMITTALLAVRGGYRGVVACVIFLVLICVDILLALLPGDRGSTVSAILFSVEACVLLSYCLITGEPDGMSALWCCILPSFGMILFGQLYGSIVCGAMLLEIILMLWTPLGPLVHCFEYSAGHLTHFPLLYCASWGLAFFLERRRNESHKRMIDLYTHYRDLSNHDAVTGLLNRQGLLSKVDEKLTVASFGKIGIAILDLDFFKKVNDTYGHDAGDYVLCEFAHLVEQKFPGLCCRWGGEEFLVTTFDNDRFRASLDEFRFLIEDYTFSYQGYEIRMTVSAGAYETLVPDFENIDRWIKHADLALYDAKSGGRNRVVFYNIEDV